MFVTGNVNRHVIKIIMMIFCLTAGVLAQEQGLHPYPRTANIGWGGSVSDWYARFDIAVLGIYTDPNQANEIKSIDPTTLVVQTSDFNAGSHLGTGIPDQFRLKMANGSTFGWYVGVNPPNDQIAPNFSDVCPYVNGKQCWQWFAEYIVNFTRLDILDGIATDGLYAGRHVNGHCPSDIDLDCNGVRDLEEHGKDWVVSHWDSGVIKLVRKIRELLGPDKLFIVDTGVGFQGHPDISVLNGATAEYWGYEHSWEWQRTQAYVPFMEQAMNPQTSIDQANPTFEDPLKTNPLKNYYTFVRFTLTKCMLGNVYYDYQDLYSPDDYYNRYYDEFDLNIGYPTQDMQRIGTTDVWVRFFDGGVAICNITGTNVTVTDADLQTLAGYDGPYYRFQGGQDPTFNNGELFSSVQLKGATFGSAVTTYVGDGIILVKTPTRSICDIIIDGGDPATSPASEAAEFNGDWDEMFKENNSFYLKIAPWKNVSLSGYRRTDGGGNDAAVFRPTIGYPGVYRVREWHGYDDGNEATNVKYTINHSGGSLTIYINQQENQGQWNDLGMYYFNKGTSGNVTISASGANGTVIADAISFIYQDGVELDNVPPNEPRNLRSEETTENSIYLTWDPPLAASDGDVAFMYQVYRDGKLISTTHSNIYLDQNLAGGTSYQYSIYTLDDVGNVSVSPLSGPLSTLADQNPPQITEIEPLDQTRIKIVYDEDVDEGSATSIYNYEIRDQISVLSAGLEDDNRTVVLRTSSQVVGQQYTLIVNNVYDRAKIPNKIADNTTKLYTGIGGHISISVAADDTYQLYVNGVLVGVGNQWNQAQQYTVASLPGKNIIAVKAMDVEDYAGLVAEIDFDGEHYVTDDNWKVSVTEQEGWESVNFDDISWQKATIIGEHGTATPWADFRDVDGITADGGVMWIWSNDNENDDTVYFRFTLRSAGDLTPPDPPSGLRKK